MDARERSDRRSPRRERERPRKKSRDYGHHPRDSRSLSPAHKRSRTSRHDRDSPETSGQRTSSKYHSSHRRRDRSHHAKDRIARVELPCSARALSKGDLATFEPLFAYYLSLQKQKDIDVMDDREVRGRWKSFVGKWNRGELAEGWYDPEMFEKITAERKESRVEESKEAGAGEAASDDDDYGPVLPPSGPGRRAGPGIPTLQDLSLRAELKEEDRQASIDELRAARKADRNLQKERLDELVPRAEPGTRERQLEKRQMVNEKMREFRDRSPGMEVGDDKELMGGADGLQEYKQMKEREQRRKTEREVRREEIQRAKREEMEERRRAWREREEGTIGMLRELARQRFG